MQARATQSAGHAAVLGARFGVDVTASCPSAACGLGPAPGRTRKETAPEREITEQKVKVVLMGDGEAGKTSFLKTLIARSPQLQRVGDRTIGIELSLLRLPLPGGLDEGPLLEAIDPEKDADGLHTLNLGRLLKGESGPRSCTPAGVMAMLRSNGIDPAGKRAVVIGRSILVGQPMALMLQAANATVTVTHSRTADLAAHTKDADILVVAAGRPGMVGAEHVRPGAAVVDVGIHRRPEGGLCGDVVAVEVEPIAAALSPVPGGVGPMTVTMLLVNTVVAWCRRHGIDHGLDDLIV